MTAREKGVSPSGASNFVYSDKVAKTLPKPEVSDFLRVEVHRAFVGICLRMKRTFGHLIYAGYLFRLRLTPLQR